MSDEEVIKKLDILIDFFNKYAYNMGFTDDKPST